MSERPKRPSKDEMTISNNFTIAFEHVPTPLTITTGEYVIKGVAAALSINNDIHVVITAPNSKVLLEAWGKITNIKLDESKTLPVYQSLIGKGDLTQIKSPELSTSKQQCNPWYWYYNPKHKECFIEETTYTDSSIHDVRLGEAIDCDVAECQELLRKNRIPRSEIGNIKIIVDIGDLIPF